MEDVDGATEFSFGKHRGKTFEQVYKADKKYVSWACGKEDANGALRLFALYCESSGATDAGNSMPDLRPSAERYAASSPRSGFVAGAGSTPESRKRSPDHGDFTESGDKRRRSYGQEANEEEAACEKCFSSDLPFLGAHRCRTCWRTFFRTAKDNFYLRCKFADKDQVKSRGARFDFDKKKWYVPTGKDISIFDRWHVLCSRCKEPLSDVELPPVPLCRPECKVDAQVREDAARRERERIEMQELAKAKSEEADRRRKELRMRIKNEFSDFIKKQAAKMQSLMEDRNADAEDKEQTLRPFLLIEGGLANYAILGLQTGSAYNPFAGEGEPLPEDVSEWMCSIGERDFLKNAFVRLIEYSPTKILDWAITFFQNYIEHWMNGPGGDMRYYVQKQRDFIEHLLLQCLDPVTPDLKLAIQDKLKYEYGTMCPDVVGIFGTKIFPRIQLTVGDARFKSLSREQKCNWAVVEYMQHRKKYDCVYKETEETTYMRDVLNKVIENLLESGALLHQLDEDEVDALYYPCGDNDQGRMFMLRNPNTKAADLFSLELAEAAAEKMSEKLQHKVETPTADELRRRIFAIFRTLHWRITRKLASGNYAVYGTDDGLREADGDGRMTRIKMYHTEYHDMMIQNHWAPRDFCGFDSKRLHSNTELVEVLFVEHLRMNEKDIKKSRKEAQRYVDKLRQQTDKQQKSLKVQLKKSGIKSTDLVELPSCA